MPQTVKAKLAYLFQEKLEAQDDSILKRKMLLMKAAKWTKMNIRTNFLIFQTKQAITLIETVPQKFLKVSLIKILNGKLFHLLSSD